MDLLSRCLMRRFKGKSFNPYNRDYAINLRDLTGYNDNTSGDSGSVFPDSYKP